MADAVAPTQGEATPSNINAETNAPAANAEAAQTSAPAEGSAESSQPIFSQDEAAKIKKFLDSHGGLDKVQQTITARKADLAKTMEVAAQAQAQNQEQAPQAPQAPAQPTTGNTPAPELSTQEPAKGFLSPYEIMARTYNNQLENDPKYEAIKDYIHKGDHLTEMKKMGMTPVDQAGNFNDAVIRQWLDIKVQTIPAPTPSTPVTNIPTAEYKEYEGGVDTYDKAMDVYRQGNAHPQFADAQKLIAEHFNGKKPAK